MKNILIGRIALGVGCLAFGARADNLLTNGDFESYDEKGRCVGWTSLPTKVWHAEKGEGENGSGGLVWENDDPSVYKLASQRVKIKPGALYTFSIRFRTDPKTLKIGTSGPTLAIELADASGKYLGGSYASCGSKLTDEWTVIRKVGFKAPENFDHASFVIYVGNGSRGRVQFDNAVLEPMSCRPVLGFSSDAYRSTAEKGIVSFAVPLELAGVNATTADVEPWFAYAGADGKDVEVPATSFTADVARLTLDVASLKMGKQTLSFWLRWRKDGKEVAESRQTTDFTRVEKLPARKVSLDAKGRTIVDGKPFFPLGLYTMKLAEDDLDRLADSPFNCVMSYIEPKPEDLDAYAAHGLKSIYRLQDAYAGKQFKTEEEAAKWVRGKVGKFKDHPAILAWYSCDEMGIEQQGQLLRRQRLMESLDAEHPTWIVLCQPEVMRYYVGTCDVIGTDPYPIGFTGGIERAAKWARMTREGLFNTRPLWQVPQAFDWFNYKKNMAAMTHQPSRDEMSCMAWQAIAEGANGLIFYSYFDLKRKDVRVPFAKTWADLVAVTTEIAQFVPGLLSDGEARKATSTNDKICLRTWTDGAATCLLAVNSTEKEQKGSIALEGGMKSATALLGIAPAVEQNAISATLPPLAVAIWRVE